MLALPPSESSARLPALIEMVKIDLQQQWQQGRRVGLETYLEAIPEFGPADAIPTDLIVAEFEARRRSGVPAELSEFEKRFPHQAEALRQIIGRPQDTATGGASRRQRRGKIADGSRQTSLPRARASKVPVKLPRQFGRYRVLRRLGRGAMGSVYLAHDSQLDRRVALKVPHFRTGGGARRPYRDDLERFSREARAAATLDHPNLCPVYDVGEIDGIHYLSMAYIRGRPLSDYIDPERPMPPRRAAAVVRKLALALEVAHSRGVVHRDLKPSNIMVNARREPVIMDFGLAWRFGNSDERLTKSGGIMGTPAYMSPEQVLGNSEALGPRCDIYSLGVIMYQMLTACLPFLGSEAAILGQILFVEPAPPSGHRPDLDPQIEAICLKAMAKKAEGRYATMSELASALGDYLHGGAPPLPLPPSSHVGPPASLETASEVVPETGASGPTTPPPRLGPTPEDEPTRAGPHDRPGEAVEHARFQESWRRWVAIVELFALRRSQSHVDWRAYDKLHKELIEACRARAVADEGAGRTCYRKMEDLILPWLTPKALAQADQNILCSLLLCCRQADQELAHLLPSSPTHEGWSWTRSRWVRAAWVFIALAIVSSLLSLLLWIAT